MPTARDVPAQMLIEKVAEKLKEIEEIKPPEWARWAKTGVHRQRPPLREDWWCVRAASVLRTLYMRGPSGVGRLRVRYGGRQDRGVRPSRFRRASGHVLRLIYQQLEGAGFVIKTKLGRRISPKGMSLLDKTAAELIREEGLEPGKVTVP